MLIPLVNEQRFILHGENAFTIYSNNFCILDRFEPIQQKFNDLLFNKCECIVTGAIAPTNF